MLKVLLVYQHNSILVNIFSLITFSTSINNFFLVVLPKSACVQWVKAVSSKKKKTQQKKTQISSLCVLEFHVSR